MEVDGELIYASWIARNSTVLDILSLMVCLSICETNRIAGGLGAVLPWLPIKAYRPCPNFIDRGGDYQRSGQGLDEIAFGRDSTFRSDS